jgi:ferrous iron transport protein B
MGAQTGAGVRETRKLKIALAGNPNSGKTSIFNSMTGARQQVGNWPGVTVEKKTGFFTHNGYDIEVVDLPGTYSLSAYSVEERVARRYLVEDKPDVVIHVVDSGNLARNLYLTVQLLELGVDLVVDLNMWDEFIDSGSQLDRDRLATLLGSPVVSTVGHRGTGIDELLDAVIRLAEEREERHRHVPILYGSHVDDVLVEVTKLLVENPGIIGDYPPRWAAIKLLEGDLEMVKLLATDDPAARQIRHTVATAAQHIQIATGSDHEKVISEGRHGYIEGALMEVLTEEPGDRMERSRSIDRIFTDRYLGYPIFLAFVWILFQLTFKLGVYPMGWIDNFVGLLSSSLSSVLPESLLASLLVDGVVGGVGSVIVFLPNIVVLFLGIAFLEDSGYMARAAFLMDKLMHALGLHGKSFIPLLMGFGCSVPAIMATRTLESRRDRTLTTLIVPLISCSARLPVYLLIGGTFFAGRAGTVVFIVYITGIVAAILIGRLLSRTLFRSEAEPFVMELPPYRLPTAKGLAIHTWERARIYLKKMGGVILVASIILWFLGAFPQSGALTEGYEHEIETLSAVGTEEALGRAAELEAEAASLRIENSYIGRAGRLVAPAIRPLGFTWEMGVSLITGFVAKEVVVSTLGVLYHSETGDEAGGHSLSAALRDPANGISPLAAFGFMIFVLLYTPCIVTVIAVKREAGTGWMWFSIGYQLVLAWLVSFAIYQIGTLVGLG